MARKDITKEAEGFLKALEEQANDIIQMAKTAEKGATKYSYDMYTQFRKLVSEFEKFCIIVENRLKRMEQNKKRDQLQEQFDRLNLLMMKTLISASLNFFVILSANTKLPIGARDLFVSELKSIYFTKEKLKEKKFADNLDDELKDNLDIAEEIVQEIIERAPGLLNFG